MTRSEEKRAQIIEAASKLFMKSGYGAVSMDAIAARANVSKRTVYGHFADKATLFIAIMDGYCAGIAGNKVLEDKDDGRVDLDDDIALGLPDRTPRTVLNAFCNRFMRILMTKEAIRLFRIILSEAERFPELAQSFNENGPKPLIRRLSTYLAEQSELGILSIPDPERAAWQLIGMIKEPCHLTMALGLDGAPTEEDVIQNVAFSVDLFIQAYSPR